QGEIEIVAGPPESQATIAVWVDANAPVIHVDVDAAQPLGLEVRFETWRTQKRLLTGQEIFSAYGMDGAPHPVFVFPDVILPGRKDRVVWYHRNEESIWPETMTLQGLAGFMGQSSDPLLHRTFGGMIAGDGLIASDAATLKSAAPRTRHSISICVLTAQTPTADDWLQQLDKLAAADRARDPARSRELHRAWWNDFWNRSWIRVSTPTPEAARYPRMLNPIVSVKIPLRFGADSATQNRFTGDIARVRVYNRELSPDEVAAHADGKLPDAANDPGCVGEWVFDKPDDGTFPNRAGDGLTAKIMGRIEMIDAAAGKCARLAGDGWIEVAYDPRLDFRAACTLEAWIRTDRLGGRTDRLGGRIIDKSQAGSNNGYLIDGGYRMITRNGHLGGPANLRPGQWNHVAGTFDVHTAVRLYSNGKQIAEQPAGTGTADTALITQCYALQRFIGACAGRGGSPIKFNGTIFTVQGPDPDYRAWGGPYWFQNTRLVYWPMLAAGDFDTMQPLLKMYLDALPLARERTRIYYGHDGAYFPETMYFWGCYANSNYGWNREGKPLSHIAGGAIARHFNGNLELLALMLDYYAHTQDAEFARTKLLPLAADIITWWDKHTKRDDRGRLRIDFASALETYHGVINDTPDVAGLQWVLDGLLALPDGIPDAGRRAEWRRLRGEIPPVPIKTVNGTRMIDFAEVVPGGPGNLENPELYAIFPFRIYGMGKPGLDLARATFDNRVFCGNWGWQQDDIQAAMLGLTDVARQYVAERLADKNPASRFSAFWGPNYDWVPDQDHGGVAMRALQAMLMQADATKILLFPAWPKQWDVDFKLHAPMNTTVEGVYRAGKLQSLNIVPRARSADVIICGSESSGSR
ncbi:MAG TPA: DUF5703 domain-containing protein, partial [Planctomycetota bacterium]|nr:DUF5703 domain-containing protein [Planctomycetota bacterium]